MSEENRGGRIFTIGHSVCAWDHFLRLLQSQKITAVLDVRSRPVSKRAPQFDRATMQEALSAEGIAYYFGGNVLGGRPVDKSLYIDGQADYELMAKTRQFADAISTLLVASRQSRTALLCAEADPLNCHRFLMIGRKLHESGVDVSHILTSGATSSQGDLEKQLVRVVGISQHDLFCEGETAVTRAYRIQSGRVAYVATTFRDAISNGDKRAR